MLINKGGRIEKKDNYGKNCLHLAIERRMNLLVEQIIKGDPALVRSIDDYEYSPLHYAALTGDVHICSLLIENGSSIALRNVYGETPLIIAAQQGHVDVIEALLAEGNSSTIQYSLFAFYLGKVINFKSCHPNPNTLLLCIMSIILILLQQ